MTYQRPAIPCEDATITVSNLTKRYGHRVAVEDLSFSVPAGQVTGFLGPNGAGKSTTMRMILGLDAPDAGRATIGGRPYAQLVRPLHHVGAILEADALHPARTAHNHLRWVAATHGLSAARVRQVLHLVGLSEVAHDRVREFSLGMRQRLMLAGALLGDPHTLILDEPMNGLDPEGVHWIRNLLRDFAAQGRAVLVSSHLISEVALVADRIVIIGRGRLLASGTLPSLVDPGMSLEDFYLETTRSKGRHTIDRTPA